MLRFENNTLAGFEDGAIMFNTTGLDVRVSRVLLDMPCDCAALESWGRDLLNVPRYPPPPRAPSVAADTLLCRVGPARGPGLGPGQGPGPPAFVTVQDYKQNSCGFFSFNLDVLLVVALSLGVALLAVVALAVLCCRRRRARRKRRRWSSGAAANNNGSSSRTPTMIRDISDDKEVQEALRRKQPRPNTQFRRVQVLQPEEERLKKGPFTLVVPDGRVGLEPPGHRGPAAAGR